MSGATIGSELPLFVVPYRQNVNFTGREEQLRQIEQQLDAAQGHVRLVVAGLGGLGKTQLALEYSYRQRDAYDLVYWLKAGEPAALGAGLSALAGALGLIGVEIGDQEALRRRLFAWLESTEARWLLVYDNADAIKPADLNDYLPQAGNGHVLITSRNPRWRKMAAVLELGVFEPGEAAAFLKKRTGRDGGQGAADLAEALGYLPLALEHAAAYSEETGAGFTAYRSYFDEQRAALWADAEPPDVYHATVSTTWELSLKRIEDEAAIQLLELCSFLAPDDIPLSLLRSPDDDVPLPAALRAALHDPLRLDKAIAGLRRYSLLAREDDLLSVHRLVQAIMRDRMGAERASEWANVAIGLFLAAFPEDLQYSWHTWHDGPRLLSHVAAAVGYADRRGVELEQVALLYNETGYYLNQFGDSAGARPYYERALAINEKVLGAEHPDTATSLNNLGALLDTQGEYAAARPYYERALAIREKVLGAEHPDTARSLNNLGFLLQAQGEYAAARPYYERALAINEKVLGAEHPDTAQSLNNLGFLLDTQGEYAAARPYYERALAIREKVLGAEHPDTARSLNNLGALLDTQGEYEAARPYFERALAIREKVLGAEHPDTARSLNNLGALLDTQGEYEAARPYFERALAINEKVLGAEHPDTALSLNNLGFLLDTQGEYAAARPYYERALAILESQLGPDHPNTITSRSNLDTLLLQMEAAEAYAGDSYQVNLEGSGAIAQGEGTIAAGERGVLVGGDVGGSIITGSGNIIQEFAPGAKSLAAERIRLDVAHPEQAFVDEPFELAVAVRQPDAPPISVEELARVVSEEGTVYRPADEEVIRYRIEVSGGDDWQIDPTSYDILLRRGENGPPRFFQVTALRQGRGTLLVNAYQEDQALAAQTRIRIEVQIPVEKKIDPTHEQEVHQMDIILTPAEAEQFHEALLAAFNRSELKQVVYFSLETPYEEIVASGAFSSEVYSLVLWVNKQNKVMALLKEARERNEGNVELREFEEAIVAKYATGPAEDDQEEEPESETPEQDPRKALIDELLRLPVATTQAGRTSLLHGIPGANTLNRDMNIARLDLDLIVTQLAERGRLANGQLALVMLIDNALPYAEGFEAEPRLKKIRQQLLAA